MAGRWIPRKGSRYGIIWMCPPVNPETGNPMGKNLTATEWCEKYHYSKAQLRTLARDKRIFGFKHSHRWYILDQAPLDL